MDYVSIQADRIVHSSCNSGTWLGLSQLKPHTGPGKWEQNCPIAVPSRETPYLSTNHKMAVGTAITLSDINVTQVLFSMDESYAARRRAYILYVLVFPCRLVSDTSNILQYVESENRWWFADPIWKIIEFNG